MIFSLVLSMTKVLPRVLEEKKRIRWASYAQSKEGGYLVKAAHAPE